MYVRCQGAVDRVHHAVAAATGVPFISGMSTVVQRRSTYEPIKINEAHLAQGDVPLARRRAERLLHILEAANVEPCTGGYRTAANPDLVHVGPSM